MSRFIRLAIAGAAVTAPIGAYALLVRPWMRRWGVDATEAATVMPGDDLVPEATAVETRGITIDAVAEDVWPWLMQLGYGRGGWYSYDRLDMKGHSATEILPEWQGLQVGDTVPTHPDGGFEVRALEPGRALVLYVDSEIAGQWKKPTPSDMTTSEAPGLAASGAILSSAMPTEFAGTMAFILKPMPDGRTRLIERVRFHFPDQASGAKVAMEALGLGVFLMLRKELLGIRERAERLARSKLPAPYVATPAGTTLEAPAPA
jgi:hypothetical protein